MVRPSLLLLALALAGWLDGSSVRAEEILPEALPAGAVVKALEVVPASVELRRRHEYAQVLVIAQLEDGERIDVTRIAAAEVSGAGVAVSSRGVVTASADGAAEVRFRLGDQTAVLPVTVRGQTEPFVASFIGDVAPILSRVGCNAGTCHGSQQGKRGFKLSLRGNDPAFDHVALTDDLAGRRFNRAVPEQSLFLLKVSGAVPHEGGVLTQPGQPYYEILKSWVAGGVQLDESAPRVVKLEILPRDVVLALPGRTQQMVVHATYADGRQRDVSAEAFVESSNTEVVAVDRQGVARAIRRGETAIMARFEGNYAVTQMYVMGDRAGFEWNPVPEHNYVDTLVYKKLQRVKTLPSELCTDAEFLRRVYLDLTGLPPKPRELHAFLLDRRESKQKRDEVVDRLIGSAEFIEHWTSKWCDLLQVNDRFLGRQGVDAMTEWVRQAVASNMPYDQMVRAILDSSGSTIENPPTSYYKVLRQPDLVMENTTQLFLGIRFNCNKCHDHPFERWTQANHWEMAAFFAQVGRKNAPNSPMLPTTAENQLDGGGIAVNELIADQDSGEVIAPYSGKTALAAFPYKLETPVPDAGPRRAKLASWLTSEQNPYFARSYVNRLWSYFLGVGLIDPVDDIRASNPPSNPELLERLTTEFVSTGFDTRHIVRAICKSRVYQQSCETNRWNVDDAINCSHALPRRLGAETLYDAIHQATGALSRLPGARRGMRTAEMLGGDVDAADGFLGLFGRPPRQSACECERVSGMSLGHALSLVNGPTVAEAIKDPQNLIAEMVAREPAAERIVDQLFVSILCRPPTAAERAELVKGFDAGDAANATALSSADHEALQGRFAAWEKSQNVVIWTPLEVGVRQSAGGASFKSLEDGSTRVEGTNPEKDTYTLVGWTGLQGITGLRLEALPDDALKAKGPGRSDNGNFVLSELKVAAAPARDPGKARTLELLSPSADFAQDGWPIQNAVDGKPETGWAILPRAGARTVATFETKEDLTAEGGHLLTLILEQGHGSRHTLGRFRLSVTSSKRPVKTSTVPEDIGLILLTESAQRTPEQKATLFRHYLGTDREMTDKIRLGAAQDLAWALINSPAFLFNR